MPVHHLVGSTGRSAFGAGLLILGTGCFSRHELPVRSQPPRAVPTIAIEPAPQAQGVGRVVLDSTDGPATVHLKARVKPDMRACDMAALVDSAATPGLKDRIRAFRSAEN